MPRKDGSGPCGQGAMTGRGLGNCGADGTVNQANPGFGRGRRGSCKRAYCNNNSKQTLEMQKSVLESRLKEINKQLAAE